MLKTIKLNDSQSIEVNSSMGWFSIYRNQFGHDILPDLLPLVESLCDLLANMFGNVKEGDSITEILSNVNPEDISAAFMTLSGMEITTVFNITWAMAKNAHDDIETPDEWMKKFDTFPLDVVIKELFTIIVQSVVSTKNSKRLLEVMSPVTNESR